MPSGWESLVSRNSGSREHSCWDELGLIVPVRSPCAPRGNTQGDSCSGTRWLVFTAETDRCELEWVLQFPSLKIGWTVRTRALPLSFSLSLKMDELASWGAVGTNSEWCLSLPHYCLPFTLLLQVENTHSTAPVKTDLSATSSKKKQQDTKKNLRL